MAYKVFMKVGKAQMGSTPLKNKSAVVRWVKTNPMGNWKTPVVVTNLRTREIISGIKAKFMITKPNFKF